MSSQAVRLGQKQKRILFIAAGGLAFLLILAAALPLVVDINRYRPELERQMEARLGRAAAVGGLRLSVLGGIGVELRDVTVGEDPSFGDSGFAALEEVHVGLRLLPLFAGRVEVSHVALEKGEVALLRDPEGRWNVQSLGQGGAEALAPEEEEGEDEEEDQDAPDASPPGDEEQWTLPALSLREVRVKLQDAQKQVARNYSISRLELSAIAPGREADYFLRLALDGHGEEIESEGEFGPLEPANLSATPVQGSLRMASVPIDALLDLLPSQGRASGITGLLSTDTKFSGSLSGPLELGGETTGEGLAWTGRPSLAGEMKIRLQYSLLARVEEGAVEIREMRLFLPSSVAEVTGSLRSLRNTPQIQLAVSSPKAAVQDVLALASAFGYGPPPGTEASGEARLDIEVSGEPAKLAWNGSLELAGFRATLPRLQDSIDVSDVKVIFTPHALETTGFEAALGSGPRFRGAVRGDDLQTNPRWDLDLTTSEKMPLDDLLAIASLAGVSLPDGYQAQDGTIFLDVHLRNYSPQEKKLETSGSIALDGAAIRAPNLPDAVRISSLNADFSRSEIHTNEFAARIGEQTAVRLKLDAVRLQSDPAISGMLRTEGAVSASHLAAIAGVFGMDTAKYAAVSGGEVAADLRFTNLRFTNLRFTNLSPKANRWEASGNVALQELVLRPAGWSEPLRLDALEARLSGRNVAIQNLQAALGGTDLSGTVRVENPLRPSLRFDLTMNRLDLEEFRRITSGDEGTEKTASTASAAFPETDQGGKGEEEDSYLSRMSVEGSRITAGELIAGSLRMTAVSADVSLRNQVLRLSNLRYGLSGGEGVSQISLDLSGRETKYEVQAKLTGADLNELLGQNPKWKNQVHGELTLDADVSGSASSAEEIWKQVTGSGQMRIQNGRLAGIDLGRRLAAVTQLEALAPLAGGEDTPFEEMTAKLEVSEGRLRTDAMQIQTPLGRVTLNGWFGLDGETDASLLCQLSPELSRQVAESSPALGLAAATFFRNDQGEVVIPLRMTGSLSQPAIALDSQVVAQNLVNRLRRNILGSGLGGSSQPQTAAEGEQAARPRPGDLLRDVVGGFLGGRRSSPAAPASEPPSSGDASEAENALSAEDPATAEEQANQPPQQPEPIRNLFESIFGGKRQKQPSEAP